MADLKLNWIANDDPIIKSFNDTIQKAEDMKSALEELTGVEKKVFDGISKSTEKVKEALNKPIQSIKGFRKELEATGSSGNVFRRGLARLSTSLRSLQENVSVTVKGLKAKKTALLATSPALKTVIKGLQLFKIALISTGIGAIVVALGTFVAFLTKSQKGIDLVSQGMAIFGSVIDNVIEKATQVGEILFNVFSGQTSITDAISETGDALSGFGDELLADAQAANALEKASQTLRESQRALRVEFAEQRAEIERLRNIGEDTTRTLNERQRALEGAIRIETELEQKRSINAAENLRIIQERNSLGNSLTDDLDAEADAEVELAQIRAEADQRRRESVNKLNSLRKEGATTFAANQKAESDALKKLADDYDKLAGSVSNRVESVELGKLSGLDLLKEETRIAIEELEKVKEEALKLAQAQGKELPERFLNDIGSLIQDVNEPLRIALGKEQDKLKKSLNPELQFLDDIESGYERLENRLNNRVVKIDIPEPEINDSEIGFTFAEKLGNIFDNLLTELELDDEDLKEIAAGVGTVFNSITSSIAASNQAELEANQKIIDQLDSRVDETESALNRELELKKAGLANNFDIEKENLDKITAQREEAILRNQKIEEKAAKNQAKIDTVTQSVGLITSASNIFKAFSAIPFVGVPLAIAAIGSMFGFFAKAKIDAAKAAQIPSFREGTESIEGAGTPTSDSILANVSVKERIVPYRINKDLLDAGIMNNDLARYAILGQQILEQGITAIPQFSASDKIEATRTETARIKSTQVVTKQDFQDAVEKGVEKKFNELIKTNSERPDYIPKGDYIEKKKIGNTVYTKIVSA